MGNVDGWDGAMKFWKRPLLAGSAGFLFGAWLHGRGVPLEAAILLSVLATVALMLMTTRKTRRPRQ